MKTRQARRSRQKHSRLKRVATKKRRGPRRRLLQRGGTVQYPPESIKDHIHHVLYINLDSRTDRKDQVEKELQVFPNEKKTRISAVEDKTYPMVGCIRSHLKALETAKEKNYFNVLITEDDFVWSDIKDGYASFEKLIKAPYDVIMFGGTSATIEKDTNRVKRSQSGHGYLVHNRYYNTIIDKLKGAIQDFEKAPSKEKADKIHVDLQYTELQPLDQWYLVDPPLATQRPSYSNISKANVNYKELFKVKKEGGSESSETLPIQIYTCWLGPWEMSKNRKECLESIQKNIGVKHIHITDQNLKDYIKADAPFHEGYQYLSGNHRGDYLRCYLMHHYGGGYTDVKRIDTSWEPYFKELENAKDKWILGYKEKDPKGAAYFLTKPEDKKLVEENWTKLVGNGAFICRPNTPFTKEWYDAVHREMDKHLDALKKHPSKLGRNSSDITKEYPVEWAGLQGAIFHPLCVKYHDKLLQSLPYVNTENYL